MLNHWPHLAAQPWGVYIILRATCTEISGTKYERNLHAIKERDYRKNSKMSGPKLLTLTLPRRLTEKCRYLVPKLKIQGYHDPSIKKLCDYRDIGK